MTLFLKLRSSAILSHVFLPCCSPSVVRCPSAADKDATSHATFTPASTSLQPQQQQQQQPSVQGSNSSSGSPSHLSASPSFTFRLRASDDENVFAVRRRLSPSPPQHAQAVRADGRSSSSPLGAKATTAVTAAAAAAGPPGSAPDAAVASQPTSLLLPGAAAASGSGSGSAHSTVAVAVGAGAGVGVGVGAAGRSAVLDATSAGLLLEVLRELDSEARDERPEVSSARLAERSHVGKRALLLPCLPASTSWFPLPLLRCATQPFALSSSQWSAMAPSCRLPAGTRACGASSSPWWTP